MGLVCHALCVTVLLGVTGRLPLGTMRFIYKPLKSCALVKAQGRKRDRQAAKRLESLLELYQPAMSAPHTSPAPLCMEMLITNFGPIRRASLSLRPLTVFIGPSNTGKSYAAMLAHSIISSTRGMSRRHLMTARSVDQSRLSSSMYKDMLTTLLSLKPEKILPCPSRTADQLMKSCKRRLRIRLENEITLNFASQLRSLSRHKSKHFFVSLKSGSESILKYGSTGLILGSFPKIDIVFQTTKIPNTPHVDVEYVDANTIHARINRDLIASMIGLGMIHRLCDIIEEKITPRMIPHLPSSDFYFPAARTGILQAHRTISSSIVNSAPFGGLGDIQVPHLSGVVSDFVSALIDMQPFRGPYFELGEQIEQDIFGGHVDLKYSDRRSLPELVYKDYNNDNIPIHRTSSTISELAPLTLYLKHSIRHGGMLVIEEPESHLHPRNQVRLAGHLVGLVRSGVNVMITTHSGTLFEALSQYLEVSPMSPENRKRAMGTDRLYLHPNEVAPHLFVPDGKNGCTAKNISMSAEDGISQDEFVEVDKILNDTNIRIEECMR